MIVMNSFADLNQLVLIFTFKRDFKIDATKSINLLYSLFNHRGQGSLYQCLKSLNYISSIRFSLNNELKTAFNFINFNLVLTENGIKNYKKVLALTFEYFRIVKDEWIGKRQRIHLFEECKLIANLSY